MRRFSTPKRRRPYFKAWWRTLLISSLIVLFLALFAVRFFFIQGSSMKRTLLPGDMVFVDKLGFGARLPFHPISIPYSSRFYLSSIELPYIRMPGLTGIHHKDVIAFDNPMGPMDLPKDKRRVMVKRCVGLPGDTLAILGGVVRVNGEPLERPSGVIVHYHMKARRASFADHIFEEHGIEKPIKLSNRGDYVVPLTQAEVARLEADSAVSFVKPWRGDMVQNSGFFPDHPGYPWRPGNVGPLWVPEKGATVELDTSTLPLYERIIEVYEGHHLKVADSVIRIDGEVRSSYTFEMDYFYVLGDSRPYSKDSRVWGFLPEDHIVGRVLFVLYSYDMEGEERGFRWGRNFRGIE